MKEHGDKFHRCVTLEGPTGESWKVRLKIQLSKVQARVSFASGWRDFSRAHQLERGDLLLFSVVAESKFVVFLFSQAGKLIRRRQTNVIRNREKFPSRTLKFSDDESPSEPEPSSSSPKRKTLRAATRKGSRVLPGRITKKQSKRKSGVNRKSENARTKTRGKARFSETEIFKLLEEVAGGDGKVSHIINGKLVAWEMVEEVCTMKSHPSATEIPQQTAPSEPSTGTNTDQNTVSYDVEANPNSWPTWLQLFGLQGQEEGSPATPISA